MEGLVPNLFENFSFPESNKEIFEEILNRDGVRIERIHSSGQVSPEGFWYDQDENEWVILLQGMAGIEFADGSRIDLVKGDYLFLEARRKHRVSFTSADPACIWLAIFWK
jgi:cupin 2 domain-containing protein